MSRRVDTGAASEKRVLDGQDCTVPAPQTAIWSPDHVSCIERGTAPYLPRVRSQDVHRLGPDLDAWDAWPVQWPTGGSVVLGGAELWMTLAAPVNEDPNLRHQRARMHLIRPTADGGWRDLGPVQPGCLRVVRLRRLAVGQRQPRCRSDGPGGAALHRHRPPGPEVHHGAAPVRHHRTGRGHRRPHPPRGLDRTDGDRSGPGRLAPACPGCGSGARTHPPPARPGRVSGPVGRAGVSGLCRLRIRSADAGPGCHRLGGP